MSDVEITALQRSIAIHKQKQAEDISQRDKEIGRLNLSIATLQSTIAKQTDQNTQLKESIVKVMSELELRGTMLETEKETRCRAVVAREQAEGALEMTRQERESFRKRLVDAEALLSSASSHRAQIAELEQSLMHAKEQTRLIHDSKLALDAQIQVMNRDNDSHKMKIVALETRTEAMTKEKSLLCEEMATLREQVTHSIDTSRRRIFITLSTNCMYCLCMWVYHLYWIYCEIR